MPGSAYYLQRQGNGQCRRRVKGAKGAAKIEAASSVVRTKYGVRITAGRSFRPEDESGNPLRDSNVTAAVFKKGDAQFLLCRCKPTAPTTSILVWELAKLSLAETEKSAAPPTFKTPADVLIDFCSETSRRWQSSNNSPASQDCLHAGYGQRSAAELRTTQLTKAHIDDWMNAHPVWGPGARRIHSQAVRRMLRYGIVSEKLSRNSIRGVKFLKSRPRATCVRPEA